MATPKRDILTPPPADAQFEETIRAPLHAVVAEGDTLPVSQWLVNGVPFLELDAIRQAAITWRMTDQGLNARQTKVEAAQADYPRVELLRDTTDLRNEQYEDEDEDKCPMREIMDANAKPGFVQRFISTSHRGGKRNFEIATDAKGDPVKYRSMVLGRVPVDVENRRKRTIIRRATNSLRDAVETMRDDRGRAMDDMARHGITSLRRGDMLTDHTDPDRGGSIGVIHSRGEGADAK